MNGQEGSMRVLIADREPNVRQALWLVCEEGLHLTVAGEAADAPELLTLVRTTHPDMLLLDWGLTEAPPAELIRTIRGIKSLVIIVVGAGMEQRRETLAAGADAFIYKGDPPEKVLALLRTFIEPQDCPRPPR
ncbi:MAG: response regulator transcription factor [Anaerolineae bacterium]|nr:response regulator transcription factor [Anaerolineae bacterium]